MTTTQIASGCPACGAPMIREIRADVRRYKGHSIAVQQPGLWCTACDEAVFTWQEAMVGEAAFHSLKAQVDGLLGPAEVARIRKRIGLSQRAAGELLGGGVHAFHKYEKGEQSVSEVMANLLRLLDRHPELLQEIRAARAA